MERDPNKLPPHKVRLVLGLCFGVFALNVLWLTVLQRSDRSQLHANALYPVYLQLRSLMLRPLSIVMVLIWGGYGLYWVFKPRQGPAREFDRLAALAMVTCMFLGLILAVLFRL